jgi:predicted amidohydrolase
MDVGVAVAQLPAGFSVPLNVKTIIDALAVAKPNDVVVTPEGSLTGYPVNGARDLDRLSTTDPSEIAAGIDALARQATRRGIHVWIGVCRRQGGEWTNEAIGLLADGTRLIYRKINLATVERESFRAGDDLPVFKVPLPSVRAGIGLQLCREVRFPEQWRSLAERGARLFLHMNNGQGGRRAFETWRAMLIARAAENQRFIASANAASPSQHCPSLVVAPDGDVMAELQAGETDAQRIDLHLDRTADWYLDHRRRDLAL